MVEISLPVPSKMGSVWACRFVLFKLYILQLKRWRLNWASGRPKLARTCRNWNANASSPWIAKTDTSARTVPADLTGMCFCGTSPSTASREICARPHPSGKPEGYPSGKPNPYPSGKPEGKRIIIKRVPKKRVNQKEVRLLRREHRWSQERIKARTLSLLMMMKSPRNRSIALRGRSCAPSSPKRTEAPR